MNSVLTIILGGGRGTRLFPLTQYRSKPAVPIGGKYRLIDIPISNSLHSGIDRIFVLTMFNSASLNRHIAQTYRFDSFSNGFVEILAAEQTSDNPNWYQGTADAVRQQISHISDHKVSQYLILSGDHLYRMDYLAFVDAHRAHGADMTVAVKPVTRAAAPELGILKSNPEGWITDFVEKPKSPRQLDMLEVEPQLGGDPQEVYLASMGIYIFESKLLLDVLQDPASTDFGKHIIPNVIKSHRVHAHRFGGYWEDIGTIRAFYNANLDLTNNPPPFTFHRHDTPVYTHQRHLAPTRLDGCTLRRCNVGEGSFIKDSEINRSIVGIRSLVGPHVMMSDTVMMGADFYETPAERASNEHNNRPSIGIGSGCIIKEAIIDKNARIGSNVIIQNEKRIQEADGQGFAIRDGIVVIPKNAVIPDGTVI